MIKGLGSLMQAMKQAQSLQGRLSAIQSKLAELRVEGTAGGGMVIVTADGQQRLVDCRIEPGLLSDREMLEELIVAAVNQAMERAREAAASEMATVVEGMGLGGLREALSGFQMPDNSP